MRLLIVSDAWFPQINGVVRTLDTVRKELEAAGDTVKMITPDLFRTMACPTYPEIRLALWPGLRLRAMIEEYRPQAIHIATEGPLGWAARKYCLKKGYPFTTAYHTKFPEYVYARTRAPISWGYKVMRHFHKPSQGVMVATQTIRKELEDWGFDNVKDWTRGVDTDLFRPDRAKPFKASDKRGSRRPRFIYVGRVAVEKNIEAFLKCDLEGDKVVVGDGPMLRELMDKYPEAVFVGAKTGVELATEFANGDVFVFPSRTDTFGLVMLEALASGLPVAAYPVPGPLDVIGGTNIGVLDEDLTSAANRARYIPKDRCREYALKFSWTNCAMIFRDNLCPFEVADGTIQQVPADPLPGLAE